MDSRTFSKTDIPLYRNKPSKSENIIINMIKAFLMKKNVNY